MGSADIPNIDLQYGVEAYKRGDGGFLNAKSLLNVLEGIGNMVYLYKTEVSSSPIAPLIGFGIASATVSKAIMYWAKEYFCNYCNVGHNSLGTALAMWWIPTGFYLVIPSMIVWTFGKDIARSLHTTGEREGYSSRSQAKKKII